MKGQELDTFACPHLCCLVLSSASKAAISPSMLLAGTSRQGLTLVHFLAQRERPSVG